jgi:anti-sigma regulatory factor (Ser/Thr protein kinase)
MTTNALPDLGGFVHPALFYHSRREYLDGLVPFIKGGLDRSYPVLVAVPGPNLAVLREALGDAADDVLMADMTLAGRNPGRILGGVLSNFVDKHAGRPVWIIGEPIWSTRSEIEYPACVQHEALINNAFAGRAEVTILCPYDAAVLDDGVLADARVTHPVVWQDGLEEHSTTYAPDAVWSHYNQPLAGSPTAVSYTIRTLSDLGAVRAFVSSFARWFGASDDRIGDLQLIATELATCSLRHTDGPCRLAFWQEDGHFICEVRDTGCLDDPLAGRRGYESDTTRGRGLFVVNAVADLVRTHLADDATTIRAYRRLGGAA